MKKLFFLLSIIFLSCKLSSQSIGYLESQVKTSVVNRDTTALISNLKKLQFYSSSVNQKRKTNQDLFNIYLQTNQIKEAKYRLDYHQRYFSADSVAIYNQSYSLFKLFYKKNYWNYAYRMLQIAKDNGLSQNDYDFLTFAINYENFNYSACEKGLTSGHFRFKDLKGLKRSLKKLKRRKRNPKVAATLSIIPGMGQLYSGDIKNTLNSMALNGVLVYSSYWLATNTHPIAAVPVVLIGSRYYAGGISNSRKYADKRNVKNRERFRASVFSQFITQ